ncbi:MAG: phytoene/squalene synthase family protein [Nitrosomonas sp.]|nr:phytoene/squalene synthase family protein [Nitrosomonas sp.]
MPTSATLDDFRYQEYILQGVSRTFALTIPQLPSALQQVIGNAYLLCRIIDTVEDDNALDAGQTRHMAQMFSDVVSGKVSAAQFSEILSPLLSNQTIPAEHDLIQHTDAVIRITHGFNPIQRQALERCVSIMGQGMIAYQETASLAGLANLEEMNRYCYYVAGVVGEMLTELFCDHSATIRQHKSVLMELAVSFGQGLQMTNILKDIWEDQQRGACWLPQDIFLEHGFELKNLRPGCTDPGFQAGLLKLTGIARAHLSNALTYTCLLPVNETGIRRFCLWAIGMAVLTLNKLHANPDFTTGSQVKISRRSVRATIMLTNLLVSQNWALQRAFILAARKLPVGHL